MGSAETPGGGGRDAGPSERAEASADGPGSAAATPSDPLSAVRATFAAFAGAPRALAAAAVLVAAQGLLLVGLGVWQVVRGFGHHIDNLGRAEFGGVLCLVCGVVVVGLARAQMVRRATSKTPIVVIELLCLPVGWAMLQNGLLGYGLPLLVVAVATLALLALAASRS
ncbi:hypothetical protein I6A60_40090 [Frankia sp. AgB1.9]|uniref:hypothetical protein n=1 Tax=unclassified Frankia TaxID=2632575 RepID=UPI001931692C|nr:MULTISPECIES: hypothetical protein [unclassified Frankia]MBL7493235.1 hypothetical protein [Frankia sp. AgW1.1]MBL7553987.1 hypothetical protein [Frankia sp. AgB1.9]MBL7619526.1 hypothetical protein [Frankia sp. AgB1.8]